MKGLLIKDLLLLKKQKVHLIYLCSLLFYIFYTLLLAKENSMIITMSMLLCTMLTITTISYDDLAKWDKYALSMPVTRKDIVNAKYLLLGITVLGGGSIGFLVSVILDFISHKQRVYENLMITGFVASIGISAISIMLPLIFKFGVEKSRLLLFGVVAFPSLLVLFFSKIVKILNIPKPSQATLDLLVKSLFIIIPIVTILVILITYRISVRIYSKKDF
ncbi:MAG: ABC-2 transporter permease [Clostridiales bacterium]|nr:ABC-2 transporter permease [Clostridiales bacterium]